MQTSYTFTLSSESAGLQGYILCGAMINDDDDDATQGLPGVGEKATLKCPKLAASHKMIYCVHHARRTRTA